MAIFKELGPYRIQRRIGKGGMGEVYLAEDSRLLEDNPDYLVALKVMWRELEEDSAVLEAERRGAELQSQLHEIDPRVARVNAFGDLEECFFIDMEYVDGQDLAWWIQQGPMAPLEAARIAMEVADILDRVHTARLGDAPESRGVVHGDIKPRNIRIEPSGRVRLMDFGIAKALSLTRRLTRNEFGSVDYSSPERLTGGSVDEHSDLWSLAVVLYEMLQGVPPFSGENTRRTEQRILAKVPPRPLAPHVPIPLKAVINKALSGDLQSRYPSAALLRRALSSAYEQLRDPGRSTGRQDITRRLGVGPSGDTLRREDPSSSGPLWQPPATPPRAKGESGSRSFSGGSRVPAAPAAPPLVSDEASFAPVKRESFLETASVVDVQPIVVQAILEDGPSGPAAYRQPAPAPVPPSPSDAPATKAPPPEGPTAEDRPAEVPPTASASALSLTPLSPSETVSANGSEVSSGALPSDQSLELALERSLDLHLERTTDRRIPPMPPLPPAPKPSADRGVASVAAATPSTTSSPGPVAVPASSAAAVPSSVPPGPSPLPAAQVSPPGPAGTGPVRQPPGDSMSVSPLAAASSKAIPADGVKAGPVAPVAPAESFTAPPAVVPTSGSPASSRAALPVKPPAPEAAPGSKAAAGNMAARASALWEPAVRSGKPNAWDAVPVRPQDRPSGPRPPVVIHRADITREQGPVTLGILPGSEDDEPAGPTAMGDIAPAGRITGPVKLGDVTPRASHTGPMALGELAPREGHTGPHRLGDSRPNPALETAQKPAQPSPAAPAGQSTGREASASTPPAKVETSREATPVRRGEPAQAQAQEERTGDRGLETPPSSGVTQSEVLDDNALSLKENGRQDLPNDPVKAEPGSGLELPDLASLESTPSPTSGQVAVPVELMDTQPRVTPVSLAAGQPDSPDPASGPAVPDPAAALVSNDPASAGASGRPAGQTPAALEVGEETEKVRPVRREGPANTAVSVESGTVSSGGAPAAAGGAREGYRRSVPEKEAPRLPGKQVSVGEGPRALGDLHLVREERRGPQTLGELAGRGHGSDGHTGPHGRLEMLRRPGEAPGEQNEPRGDGEATRRTVAVGSRQAVSLSGGPAGLGSQASSGPGGYLGASSQPGAVTQEASPGRRESAGSLEAGSSENAAGSTEEPAQPLAVRLRRTLVSSLLVLGAGLLAGLGLLWYLPGREAPRLEEQLRSHALDCSQGWARYQALRGQSPFPRSFPTVEARLGTLCEQEVLAVFDGWRGSEWYLTGEPEPVKTEWGRARDAATHLRALQDSPRRQAWEQYAQAQADRLAGKDVVATEKLFRSAAGLDPFCDPRFGLAALHALRPPLDGARLGEDLAELKKAGCEPGSRYLWLADVLMQEVALRYAELEPSDDREVRRQSLEEMKEDLQEAKKLLEAYPGKQTKEPLRELKKRLNDVEDRLQELGS